MRTAKTTGHRSACAACAVYPPGPRCEPPNQDDNRAANIITTTARIVDRAGLIIIQPARNANRAALNNAEPALDTMFPP